ncbi:outer membrane protein [Mesorhizobium sp. KR1-2]|uniref:outer membrane protein n=1 Tax=Mesorhizobium sp. KR1-2 TaxID=3156609 RepID=UPI0032B4C35B
MTKSSVLRAGLVAVLLSTTSAAFAADIVEPVVYTPIFTWTGFYVGIVGGYNWGRVHADFEHSDFDGHHHANGGLIGGTAGYNYQFDNNVVLGLETDLAWSGNRGDTDGCRDGNFDCDSKNGWLGTTRARLGYAYDRFLPYVTAGAAYGHVRFSTFDHNDESRVSDSDTRFGWAAGTGLEYAFTDQLTGKVEYMYTDLGRHDFRGHEDDNARVRWTANSIRFGLNYKF